jgi:hypothetical protein
MCRSPPPIQRDRSWTAYPKREWHCLSSNGSEKWATGIARGNCGGNASVKIQVAIVTMPPRQTSGPGSTLPVLRCTEGLLRNGVGGRKLTPKRVKTMSALPPEGDVGRVSSFPVIRALFPCYPRIVSLLCRNLCLLIFAGNFAKNAYECCIRWRPRHCYSQILRFFPVNFPVSREFCR